MRLVTFEGRSSDPTATPLGSRHAESEGARPGARRLGAWIPAGPRAGCVVDLNRALAMKLDAADSGAPEAEADSLLPADALRFLARGGGALRAAADALAFVDASLAGYEPPDLFRAGVLHERERIRLLAPVPRPGKIVAVARNYPAHAAESGGTTPGEPVLFLKAPSAVIGPEEDVVLPAASGEVDFEGELAVVMGRRARDLDEAEALDAVAGYTVADDVSARDWQGVRGQHFIGKSCDTFAPLGPALVTRDEVSDVQDLAIETRVSGELLQSARTKEMTFPVARLVAFASRLFTWEPGDVLLTGTPAGVGRSRRPPRWLREGDVVEVTVERIGTLRHHVTARRDGGWSDR
jgi:2-keto-4-pentenoate hydratase/2-oxohepta-3-ene-1,7-dioic acid hydratase in catechol pathway